MKAPFMENVFLFTGENGFTLEEELHRWIREFKERHGEENFTRLAARGLSASAFLNEVATAPFIAERRLVVIDDVPSFASSDEPPKGKGAKSKAGMGALLAQVHPQVVVLFVAPKPDRRLSATKELLELATVKTFAPLTGDALLKWVQEAFRTAGTDTEKSIPGLLIRKTGEDQRALAQEIRKLALFAGRRTVTPDDLELLVFPSAEQTVWHLLDLLGEGRSEEAVLFCRDLLRSGESAQSIWNIFLWIVSSLVAVTAAVKEGTTGIQEIMQSTGVKFGAARSLLPLARACRLEPLKALLLRVTDADLSLKTGSWKAGADGEEELIALLDRSLLQWNDLKRA